MSTRGRCQVCGKKSQLIPAILSACVDCVRERPKEALPLILQAHAGIRGEFGLPLGPLRAEDGVECPLCTNACCLSEGEIGLCGLRTVQNGHLVHLTGTPKGALVSWYDDPLPTNCAADWTCGRLPFPLLGIDSALINDHLYRYTQRERITFTRSRPHKKNDQAHVEQKNWSVARRLVGYDRYYSPEALVY